MRKPVVIAIEVLSLASAGCLPGTSPFPDPGSSTTTVRSDAGGGEGGYDGSNPPPPVQCTTDDQCGGQQGCIAWACVAGSCQRNDPPAGTPASPQPANLLCKRVVCDGHGNTAEQTDLEVTGPDTPHDCMKPTCAADGTPTLVPDASDLPLDSPNDCVKPACAPDGTPTTQPDPGDVPVDQPGDCQKNACDSNGNPTTVPDDSDPPPPTTCDTYTCSGGSAVATPANVGNVCSSDGFACSTTGTCDVCPAVDAACTDPGPAASAHSPQAAVDYQGIGYCDNDGHSLCGALTSGESAWFTYRDDGDIGFLCVFDPYYEVKPTAPATLCVYFDCAGGVTCPAGSTPATSAGGQGGCCAAAPPGVFTGMRIDFCDAGRVQIEVRNDAPACTGYELDFHD